MATTSSFNRRMAARLCLRASRRDTAARARPETEMLRERRIEWPIMVQFQENKNPIRGRAALDGKVETVVRLLQLIDRRVNGQERVGLGVPRSSTRASMCCRAVCRRVS